MSEIARHIRAYTILASILAIGVWGIIWFSYDRPLQVFISLSMCASYFVWGIVHHAIEGKLYPRIFFDYLAISFLGLVLLLSLLFRT